MLSILNISKRYPDIRNEIDYLIGDYYTKTLSPGIKCNILKKANKKPTQMSGFLFGDLSVLISNFFRKLLSNFTN